MKNKISTTRFLNLRILRFYFCIALYMLGREGFSQVPYPSDELPGKASILEQPDKISLQNRLLTYSIVKSENKITGIEVVDAANKNTLHFLPNTIMRFVTSKSDTIDISSLHIDSISTAVTTRSKEIRLRLSNKTLEYSLKWTIILNDDQNFLRQFFDISSPHAINKIITFPIPLKNNPIVMGEVDGSPIVAGNFFWAIENPMFTGHTTSSDIGLSIVPYDISYGLDVPHRYKETITIGAFPEGQLRRAFAYYLDEVRARPYRPITFYDSWYDLSFDLNLLSEADCIERVKTWSDSLSKRSLYLDYFLWDSGWDDWNNMWNFNPELPNGFKQIREVSNKYGSKQGAWLSPWGGYNPFFKIRLNNAKERYQIFKIDTEGKYNIYKGLTLADPHYYQYFKGVMIDLIENHGVMLFKIDGMGPGKDANGAGKYEAEMYALINLIKEIREFAPEVYINLTVGTWPSPFWLCYADNIWKGGDDYGFTGAGNVRQRWMNFRDEGVLKGVKKRAPLCPISSAMLHGVTNADLGPISRYEMDDRYIEQDIWSFFASGTSLQELYINPHKLNTYTWDILAKAIKWSRENKETLIDANWVGGDPSIGEVYGYAAWSPTKSTLMLRNPSNKRQKYIAKLNEVLELPHDQLTKYSSYNVVKNEEMKTIISNRSFEIELEPFEVMVLDLTNK